MMVTDVQRPIKVAFITDEFRMRAPVQQLLDRFLIGCPIDGRFHKPFFEVVLVAPQKNADIERRITDFGLHWQQEPIAGDATAVFTRSDSFLPASRCFFHGVPHRGLPGGVAGTAIRGALPLPPLVIARETRFTKAAVVVQGIYPTAELEALDAILPLIWRAGTWVRSVAPLRGSDFWHVLKRDFWPLVKSAISRSDSPQGNAVRDGRTEDLVGLGLLEGLVKEPRGWLIEHEDGFQWVIAIMDGAVADYNVALQTRAGGILSAQAHRGPPPGEFEYNRLAAMLEKYFRTGVPPWPVAQTAFVAELFERLAKFRPARHDVRSPLPEKSVHRS